MNQQDAFPYLQQMTEQFRRLFGDDFVANLMKSMGTPNWFGGANGGGAAPPFGDPSRFGRSGPSGNPEPGGQGTNGMAGMWQPFAGMGASQSRAVPVVDVYETRHEVVVVAEIPGIERASDIHLSVYPDAIVLRGEIPRRYPPSGGKALTQSERATGPFERKVSLTTRVRRQHAKATYRNGILEIRLLQEGRSESEGSSIDVDFA